MSFHTLRALAKSTLPHTLTILATYQCTAACKECCFESSPNVQGRLSRSQIFDRINEAYRSFPGLKLVVFSGGEAFLLKEDLYASIELAASLGLLTRVVTNGSWGKSIEQAYRVADRLRRAGIAEINISTGVDHQEWVPAESVVNAAFALTKTGIPALITIEAEFEDSACVKELAGHPMIRDALMTGLLKIQSNSWMPFSESSEVRQNKCENTDLKSGCSQIFEAAVVTPHDNLSACCGLTLEHIPEMRLGRLDGSNLSDLYLSQEEDFLKYWIHVDGPAVIIEKVLGERGKTLLKDVVHICQACVILHQSVEVREAMEARYLDFLPQVMAKFAVEASMKMLEAKMTRTPAIDIKEVCLHEA